MADGHIDEPAGARSVPRGVGAAESSAPAYCESCGAAVQGMRFCGTCGTPVGVSPQRDAPDGRIDVGATDGSATVAVSSRRGVLVVALLVLAAVALGLGAWTLIMSGTDTTHTLSGTMTLNDSDFEDNGDGDPCSGSGGYADIRAGTGVTVTDQEGTVIGSDTLGAGTVKNFACVFPFSRR